MIAKHRSRAEAGFTLMEMLVALGVLTTGIVSVLGLFAFALGIHKEAIDRTNSAVAAEIVKGDVLAELEARWSDGESEVMDVPLTDVPDVPGYQYRVEFTEVDDGEWIANIIIQWGPRDRRRRAEFPTVVLRKWNFTREVEQSQ
ncbi:MAG: type II secretion system protein [Planctomycetota bacterium]